MYCVLVWHCRNSCSVRLQRNQSCRGRMWRLVRYRMLVYRMSRDHLLWHHVMVLSWYRGLWHDNMSRAEQRVLRSAVVHNVLDRVA